MTANREFQFQYASKRVSMYLPDPQDHIQKQIIQSRSFYETGMLEDIRARISDISVVVDVGANIGNHTVFFGLVCGAGSVHAFEPNEPARQILEKNVELNGLQDQVRIYGCALGDKAGRGSVVLPVEDNLGMARVSLRQDGEVEVLTLDEVLEGITRCDIIKIDVEGMELAVLKGAARLLARFHPMLYVECASDTELAQVNDWLASFGYRAETRFNATPTYRFRQVSATGLNSEHIIQAGCSRKRIAFFAGDEGNFHFAERIIKDLEERGYEVRVWRDKQISNQALEAQMRWADIAWFEWANGPIMQATRLPKYCKIVCRIHRYEIYTPTPKDIDWGKVDDLIFVSPVMLDVFRDLHDRDIDLTTNVHVIPNGLDLNGYQFDRRGPGYEIAFLARFHPHKSPALMLQVIAELVRRDPNYRCHVAGPIQDLTEYQYFNHMVQEMGLEKNVLYEGIINDVDTWLKDKNHLLSTSIIESQGVVIMEAMAKGIKPVIHNNFGNPSYVFDRRFVFNTIPEAVEQITSEDYDSLSYRRFIEERYSSEQELQCIRDLLIGEGKKTPGKQSGKTPRISIVIPTFNRAHYILEAVESALQQEGNFEVLVVDDGSTDQTRNRVLALKDARVRYIWKEHSGAPATRNRGISEAHGDYILWLGSDDRLAPGTLAAYERAASKYPEADVFYGNLVACDDEGVTQEIRYPDHFDDKNIISKLVVSNMFPDGGSLVKRTLYEKVGHFDTTFSRAHDYELWSRAAPVTRFKHVARYVYEWRQHETNISGMTLNRDRIYEARVVKNLLETHAWQDLFPDLNWERAPEQARVAACERIAQILLQWNDVEGASEFLERVPEEFMRAAGVEALRKRIEAIRATRAGEQLYAEGKMHEAVGQFEFALRSDPTCLDALNNLGALAWEQGDVKTALSRFTEVLCRNPLHVEATQNAASLLVALEKQDAAVELCRVFLLRQPFQWNIRHFLRSLEGTEHRAVDEEPLALPPEPPGQQQQNEEYRTHEVQSRVM